MYFLRLPDDYSDISRRDAQPASTLHITADDIGHRPANPIPRPVTATLPHAARHQICPARWGTTLALSNGWTYFCAGFSPCSSTTAPATDSSPLPGEIDVVVVLC